VFGEKLFDIIFLHAQEGVGYEWKEVGCKGLVNLLGTALDYAKALQAQHDKDVQVAQGLLDRERECRQKPHPFMGAVCHH
jgi:hypothetical protein